MKNVTLSGNAPKRNLIVEIIASLLLIFFVHTLISSFIQLQSLKNLLAFYTYSKTEFAWGILLTEFITIVLLFNPRTRRIGFSISLLLALLAIVIMIRTPRYPHDFGGIVNDISTFKKFSLYGIISFLSGLGIIISYKKSNLTIQQQDQTVFT